MDYQLTNSFKSWDKYQIAEAVTSVWNELFELFLFPLSPSFFFLSSYRCKVSTRMEVLLNKNVQTSLLPVYLVTYDL